MLSPEITVVSRQSSETPPETDVCTWKWEESKDAVYAYGALLGVLGLGLTPGLASFKLSPLFYFVGLATITIYIGAHRSLGARERQQLTMKEVRVVGEVYQVILHGTLWAGSLWSFVDQRSTKPLFVCSILRNPSSFILLMTNCWVKLKFKFTRW